MTAWRQTYSLRQRPNRKRLAVTVILLYVVLSVMVQTSHASVVSDTKSIVGDWFNKVFEVQLVDGSTLLTTDEQRLRRKDLNQRILDGTQTEDCSLYDRFGGNISFIPYFGEVMIETGIFDRFYTKILENDGEFSMSIDDIQMFLEQPSRSNNIVYTNRQAILCKEELNSGFVDPRVAAYKGINVVGGNAQLGNFLLYLSQACVDVIAWLGSSGLYGTVNSVYGAVVDVVLGDVIKTLAMVLLPVFVCIAVFGLVRMSLKVFRGHEAVLKDLLLQTLSCLLSLGVVLSFSSDPKLLGNSLQSIISAVDTTFDMLLMVDADEVIASESSEYARAATLWRTGVFEPWCYGMFGDKYEHLYTNYAPLQEGQQAMPQSNDDVNTSWVSGEKKYNSTIITGDVVVPLGDGKEVRNWAALAWSCGSLYHIDAVDEGFDREIPNAWPKADLCPMNKQIYRDNFRWLDAKLDISPEYSATEHLRINYTGSNGYTEDFVAMGGRSLYLVLLMIPLAVLGVKKLRSSLGLVASGVCMVWFSLMNAMMPSRYDILSNVRKVVKYLYDYVWWSISLFLATTLYVNMVSVESTLIAEVLWLLASVWIITRKPIRTSAQMQRVKNEIMRAGRQVKNGVTSLGRKVRSKFH